MPAVKCPPRTKNIVSRAPTDECLGPNVAAVRPADEGGVVIGVAASSV